MVYKDKNPIILINSILDKYIDKSKYKVFLFGSRAKWDYKEYSDYDIWILWDNKISFNILLKLKSEFNETPYRVDLIDFNNIDKKFKDLAMKNIKYL
jgi:predicted nucleotidyltransferase